MSVSYCLVAVELWELKFLSRPSDLFQDSEVSEELLCALLANRNRETSNASENPKHWKGTEQTVREWGQLERGWPNDRECKWEQVVREKSTEMRHDTERKRESESGVCFDSWSCPMYLSVNVGADVPYRSALNQSVWLLTLSEGQISFTLTSSHPA